MGLTLHIEERKDKLRIIKQEDFDLGLINNPNFYIEVDREEVSDLIKVLLKDNYQLLKTLLKKKGYTSIKGLF